MAGIFGFSLTQIPKYVQDALKTDAHTQAVEAAEKATATAKTNAESAATDAQNSRDKAEKDAKEISKISVNYDRQLATISSLQSQVASLQRLQRTESDKLLLSLTVKLLEGLLPLVPPNDPNRQQLVSALDKAKKELSALEGSEPPAARTRDGKPFRPVK